MKEHQRKGDGQRAFEADAPAQSRQPAVADGTATGGQYAHLIEGTPHGKYEKGAPEYGFETETYYHVAHPQWKPGRPLYSADKLLEMGYEIPNKWESEGVEDSWTDSDVVCVFDNAEEAQWFQKEYGGWLLRLALPPEGEDSGFGGREFNLGNDTRVFEGYRAFFNEIGPAYISEIIEVPDDK